jgi:hypothetical protein
MEGWRQWQLGRTKTYVQRKNNPTHLTPRTPGNRRQSLAYSRLRLERFSGPLALFSWTPMDLQGENRRVPTTNISARNGRLARVGRRFGDGRHPPSHPAHLSRLVLLAIGVYFCSSLALWAQTSDSQTGDANKSWTATTESQRDNVNPTRTIESHTQSGNHTLDKQSVQRRESDGHFEPYQDIEKETVQVNATTTRTTTRTFGRDANGGKTAVQVIEEERHTLPGGESNVVRTTSNPDGNGKLQLIQREIEETKRTSKDVEETKTTVMLPSANGGLAPAMKMQERRERDANGTVESRKTTLLPDGTGSWQVGEIRQATTRQEGENRSTEERVSLRDSEGKLGEVSRTVSKEAEIASGEKRGTVETYSASVPGSAGDGSLHLVERATTAQRTSSTGQQTTVRQVEQSNPGDPESGLRVTILTTETVSPTPSGPQATRTIQLRDANGSYGSLGVVSVDTTKSDNIHAIQVQIAPSEKPK